MGIIKYFYGIIHKFLLKKKKEKRFVYLQFAKVVEEKGKDLFTCSLRSPYKIIWDPTCINPIVLSISGLVSFFNYNDRDEAQ